MEAAQARRAVRAAMSAAEARGLVAQDVIVLNDSNRLVARLLPCDLVARVSPAGWFSASREVELARRLAEETDIPIAGLEPRVEPSIVTSDGFEIAFWTYCEVARDRELPPREYAHALEQLHRALRRIDMAAPHFSERLAEVRDWLTDGDATPDLADDDRRLLLDRLETTGRSLSAGASAEQLLHGEPHPGNVLSTTSGPRFIDFENCAYGPIEYDLAWVPGEVSTLYKEANQELVGECRALVLAVIAAHRWRSDDRHPSGRKSGVAFLEALRAGPPWPAPDDVHW